MDHSEAAAMTPEEQRRVEEEQPKVPSVLDAIRERRKKLAEERTLDLLIPGHDGLVGVRYKAMPLEELQDAVRSLGKRGADPIGGADILIRLCETILIRNQESDKLIPLAEEMGLDEPEDNPIRFDERLVEAFELDEEPRSARMIVKALFSPHEAQALAWGAHLEAIQKWLQGQSEEIDTTLLDF